MGGFARRDQRHLPSPRRRQVPGRFSRRGRGRGLLRRAAPQDQPGPRQPLRRRAEARQRRGDRRQDRQIHSPKTFSPFLATVPAIRIVNSKVVKANAGADDGQTYLATHVASAGPYTLKSWERGTDMTIERDPNYYRGWGDGPIDEVRFVITNDEATVRSMAASGELTMSSQYQSPDTYDALAKMPRFKIVKGETSVAFYLKLNTQGRADRRRAYSQGDRARDRLRHDPQHDPAGRRSDRPAAQDLRRGVSRRPRRNSTSRPPRPKSPRAAMPARPTFRSLSPTSPRPSSRRRSRC